MSNLKTRFLEQALVLDTETTGLDPTTAEIIEFATALYQDSQWKISTKLFNTPNGIPPESSAKNQISNRMVQGSPYFDQSVLFDVLDMLGAPKYFVAHYAEYDRSVLVSSFERMNQGDVAAMFANQDLWICTWRVARHIYSPTFQDKSYAQNYLRYRLDLPVPDSIGVHRAGADVEVCGALIERLIEDGINQGVLDPNREIGLQLVELTQKAVPVKTWPTGKHKGQVLESIPTEYYLWSMENQGILRENDPGYDFDLAESVRKILEVRLSS
jgi:exodeoxyribonuclease X